MKKLKLNQLERTALNNRELEQIKGGARYCGCGCAGPLQYVFDYMVVYE